jgi:hypothetical protein
MTGLAFQKAMAHRLMAKPSRRLLLQRNSLTRFTSAPSLQLKQD